MAIDVKIMARKMRFVVVHYHIFKNAGTSVERILEREFPGGFARLHGPTADSTLDAEDLEVFLDENPTIQAVTSHHLRYPAPSLRNAVIFDCCFLRHPLDRLDSLYSYYRKIDSTDPICRNAHRQTPGEFIRQLLHRSPEQVSNVQVTHLANRGAFTRPANEADLDRAFQTVRNMALPGVVEMFQESMVAAEYFMRPAFPQIRLGSGPTNVSRDVLPGADARQKRLLQRWGGELYEEMARVNHLDIQLYNLACLEIRRRLNLIPAVPARIAEFGDRCGELTANVV
jgi:hypothetical protein